MDNDLRLRSFLMSCQSRLPIPFRIQTLTTANRRLTSATTTQLHLVGADPRALDKVAAGHCDCGTETFCELRNGRLQFAAVLGCFALRVAVIRRWEFRDRTGSRLCATIRSREFVESGGSLHDVCASSPGNRPHRPPSLIPDTRRSSRRCRR